MVYCIKMWFCGDCAGWSVIPPRTQKTWRDIIMSRVCARPQIASRCAYCEYWTGDAGLTFKSMGMGLEFENSIEGKCLKRGGTITRSGSSCNKYYEPNREAKKLL